ncbi:MAG: glycoside hydrolase [Acidobacteria bacterium]|nr:glycoside hydrolase [Acidobacteriota bacterium]
MPKAYLCFLWHMHQPFYKDLVSGEYQLPWTRLHALKDYYGMVKLLDNFPRVRQTFNLVPSLVVQVRDYASGAARDPYLDAALKPAESLDPAERRFLLQHSFYAYPPRMIHRFPRYRELHEAWEAQRTTAGAERFFAAHDIRDLQVLSQLAWFEEEFLERDPKARELAAKGRGFSLADQELVGRKQREIIGLVIPAYERAAARGQIEISTTPFYHPILPLLCDSDIARVSSPGISLPRRFRYPQDARLQLSMARDFIARTFGAAPRGFWPSEGSVSDEVFHIAAELGFEWAAGDSGVLARTLSQTADGPAIYRPYRWSQKGHELRVIFRDHFLSDLVGFVYSRMEPDAAAGDLLARIRENCLPMLAAGSDVLVPIILDGENAWEYYERNGRPFLSELYRLISEDDTLVATTVSDALSRLEPEELSHVCPGSWIDASFNVWIGAEEDNRAWEQLLQARETYDAAGSAPAENRRLALESLLIAEGSDWCWWYGPEHDSPNRPEFDQLFRSHLANVYRGLGIAPPDELSRPILRMARQEVRVAASAPVHPVIDGEVTSYFEWMGAGSYRVDDRSGAMHAAKAPVEELAYGIGGSHLFLKVELRKASEPLPQTELRIELEHGPGATVRISEGKAQAEAPGVACAIGRLLEISAPVAGAPGGGKLRFRLTLWQNRLPVQAIPQEGWLEVDGGE